MSDVALGNRSALRSHMLVRSWRNLISVNSARGRARPAAVAAARLVHRSRRNRLDSLLFPRKWHKSKIR